MYTNSNQSSTLNMTQSLDCFKLADQSYLILFSSMAMYMLMTLLNGKHDSHVTTFIGGIGLTEMIQVFSNSMAGVDYQEGITAFQIQMLGWLLYQSRWTSSTALSVVSQIIFSVGVLLAGFGMPEIPVFPSFVFGMLVYLYNRCRSAQIDTHYDIILLILMSKFFIEEFADSNAAFLSQRTFSLVLISFIAQMLRDGEVESEIKLKSMQEESLIIQHIDFDN